MSTTDLVDSAITLMNSRYRPREYDSEDGPWEPVSGAASALLGTMGSLMMGFADFPVEIVRAFKSKPATEDSKGDSKHYRSICVHFAVANFILTQALQPPQWSDKVNLLNPLQYR